MRRIYPEQNVQGRRVQTRWSDKHSQNFAIFDAKGGLQVVPQQVCSLAAGKDVWLREVLFPCDVCQARSRAEEIECGMCKDCYERASLENRDNDES